MPSYCPDPCSDHCPDDEGLRLWPIAAGVALLALAAVVWFVIGHLVLVLAGCGAIALVTGGSQYVLRRWFTVQLPTRERLAELTERLQQEDDAPLEPAAEEAPAAPAPWWARDITPPAALRRTEREVS